MTLIQKFKNGRLHIYVRQDMYKGKLKSENWVGRTFLDKKQRVFSSGTKNFEEAKVILEKWYDDLESGVLDQKNEENTPLSEIPSDSTPAQVAPLEPDNKVAENTVIEKIIKPEEDGAKSSSVLDKIKNAKFGLSFFKKTNSEVGQNKSTNKLRNKFKEIFSEKISRASVSGEEIAGVDISPDSIRVAQITKQGESWILDKVSTRLLQKDQVNNNILEAKDYVSEEIKLALANAKITTSNVAISVPVTSAIIRVVSSP
jgi:type IV pilus assembly protein PilN